MRRVQLTLDEKSLAYLRSLVESGECASLSHAVRKIIKERMRGVADKEAKVNSLQGQDPKPHGRREV